MKILLGGVPFGRNNIGDEAILEGIVTMLREIKPEAQITVSTDDQLETQKHLEVKTCPLIGFNHVSYDREEALAIFKEHDLYIWSGATGLSDYPDDAMDTLTMCKSVGTPFVIFGTGMNSELNPAKFTLQPGKKKDLLAKLSQLSCHTINFADLYESRQLKKMLVKMNRILADAEMIALRNQDSCENLKGKCKDLNINRGADLALVLNSSSDALAKIDTTSRLLLGQKRKKIGVCISAQRCVNNLSEMSVKMDQWIEKFSANIFFIPMNPISDADLMTQIKAQMKNQENCVVVKNCLGAKDVVALAAEMDTIISSRLHLLILGSINHVPLIGISRGSKVDTFLKRYNLQSCGSVEQVDLHAMEEQLDYFMKNKAIFELKSKKIRAKMMKDLKLALDMLHSVIEQTEEKIHARSA
jgi:polysaccharide pyruvyl transferase WcaK-like protein